MRKNGEYRPRVHMNRVLEASKSRNTARLVLQCMCWNAEFDRPEVTITRPQIEEQIGRCEKAVLIAYKFLKNEGSIVAIKNVRGGRGIPTTYRLVVIGQGGQEPPPEAQEGRDSPEYSARLSELLRKESYSESRRICDQEFNIK